MQDIFNKAILKRIISLPYSISTVAFQTYIIQMNKIELNKQQALMEKMMDIIADDTPNFYDNLIARQEWIESYNEDRF